MQDFRKFKLFQFHKGTIRTKQAEYNCSGEKDFNSIKVRLEHFYDYCTTSLVTTFQFHKGTIRTSVKHLSTLSRSIFQFHKGTIRTSNWWAFTCVFSNFNSIKVRLEQRLTLLQFASLHFNSIKVRLELEYSNLPLDYLTFHNCKGTIRTNYLSQYFANLFYFNSIKVRLERQRNIVLITSKNTNFNSIKVRLELW